MILYELVCKAAHQHEAPTREHDNECYNAWKMPKDWNKLPESAYGPGSYVGDCK